MRTEEAEAARFMGARIREARGGRSQAWLAKASGVSISGLRDWENGRRLPNVRKLLAIAQATEKAPSWFFPWA